jgi:hypothetical protein
VTPFPPPGAQQGSQAHSLCREAPGAGEDVVLSGIEFLHAVEVPSQQILTADLCHAGEVVDFLKHSQLSHYPGQWQYPGHPQKQRKRTGKVREQPQWRCAW